MQGAVAVSHLRGGAGDEGLEKSGILPSFALLPLDGHGELPGAGDRLDDNVGLGDAARKQRLLGALQERVDDGSVPAGVDDANAEAGAVVLLGNGALVVHCER